MNKNDIKYVIPADIFIEAFTASDKEFKAKSHIFSKYGIKRTTVSKFNRISSIKLDFKESLESLNKLTYIKNARIQVSGRQSLLLRGITKRVQGNLLLYECDLPQTEIIDSKFDKTPDKINQLPSFFLNKCRIKCLTISNSQTRNFNLKDSEVNDLLLKSTITHNFSCKNTTVREISIQSKSKIEDFEFINSILGLLNINNSTTKDINFEHSQIRYFNITNNSKTGDIRLKNLAFNFPNNSKSSFLVRPSLTSFKIMNSKTGDLIIDRSTTINLCISNSTVSDFSSRKKSTTKNLFIENSEIGDFLIENSTVEDFLICNSNAGNFLIDIRSDIENFFIEYSTITDFSMDTSISGNLFITNSSTGDFTVENSETGGFYIESSSTGIFNLKNFSDTFSLLKSKIPKVYLSESQIIELKLGVSTEVNLLVSNSSIYYLNFHKTTIDPSTSISLSNVSIYVCSMEELSILGRVYFRKVNAMLSLPKNQNTKFQKHQSNLKKNEKIACATFRISYSSLSTTEFIDCDLASFEAFEFNNSRITEMFISGGSMPDKNIRIHNSKKNSIEWHTQMVSLFNQFTSIYQAQGHIYEAINYRSKSSEFQMKLLKKKRAWRDLIPFKLNAWSNQHGASWVKALWFLIWTSALFYLFVLISTGNFFKFDKSFEPAFIGYFFDFINPLRPFDFYSEIGLKINGWTRFFDLLSRVVIGYGIYQLIAAFRRYGRK